VIVITGNILIAISNNFICILRSGVPKESGQPVIQIGAGDGVQLSHPGLTNAPTGFAGKYSNINSNKFASFCNR
jgi:hypothetical protein